MDSKATKKDCLPKKKETKKITKETKQKLSDLNAKDDKLIKEESLAKEEIIDLEKAEQEKEVEVKTVSISEKEVVDTAEETKEQPDNEKGDTDLFEFASVFGKTEKGLKDEFYAYQIRSLMERTGLPIEKKTEKRIIEEFEQAVSVGVGDVLLTPCLLPTLLKAKESKSNTKANLSLIVDYPLGESSFKARLSDVKYTLKNGADKILVVLGEPAVNFGHVGIEKIRLNKLFKASKGKLGVALNVGFSEEQLVRAVKIIENSKVESILLIAKGKNSLEIVQAIRLVKAIKKQKEILVLCDTGDLEEFSAILMENPSMIYTSCAEQIYSGLKEKFGL